VTDLLVAFALGAALAGPQTVPTEPSPDALTIEEAVRIGLENAYPIRLAEIAEDRARANRRTVASAGGFNINFQGQFFWFDGLSTGSIGTGGTRQTGGSTGGGSAPNTFNSLQVSFNQPIDISGAQRSNVRAADWFVVAAEEQTTATVNQTKGEIRAAFLQALAAQELVVVQQTRLANATERRDTTNAAYLIGERPRFAERGARRGQRL
jgi:outer membrane protein TolC